MHRNAPSVDTAVGDIGLLDDTLEIVAARVEDISPAVYARFFERCPARAGLFRLVDPTQPPHGCGQMLFEIISLLRDSASAQTYVPAYMHQIGTDHAAFGVADEASYREFLASLVDVLAAVLGDQWTAAHAEAWHRQSEALLRHLRATTR